MEGVKSCKHLVADMGHRNYFQDVYIEFERCQADIIKLHTTVQQFSEGTNLVLS